VRNGGGSRQSLAGLRDGQIPPLNTRHDGVELAVIEGEPPRFAF
jgi:hypothetical protein